MAVINNKDNLSFRKKIAISLIVFLSIILICLITNLFGFVRVFLIGTFGLLIYPLVIITITICSMVLTDRPVKFDRRSLTLFLVTLADFLCILQLALTNSYDMTSLGTYLSDCYSQLISPGGILIGLLVYPIKSMLFNAGAYVVFAIAMILLIAMIIDSYYDKVNNIKKNKIISLNDQKVTVDKMPVRNQEVQLKNAQQIKDDEVNIAKKKLGLIKDNDNIQDAQTLLFGDTITKKEAVNKLYPNKDEGINSLNPNYMNINLDKYLDDKDRRPAKIVHENETYVTPKQREQIVDNKSLEYIRNTQPNQVYGGSIISGDYYKKVDNDSNVVENTSTNFIDEKTIASYNKVFEDIKSVNRDEYGIENNYLSNNSSIPTLGDEVDIQETIDTIEKFEDSIIEDDASENDLIADDFSNIEQEEAEVVEENNNSQVEETVKISSLNEINVGKIDAIPFRGDSSKPEIKIEDFSEKDKPYYKALMKKEENNENVEDKKEPYKRPPRYHKPPLDLLTIESTDLSDLFEGVYKKKDLLEQTLESFKIPAKVNDMVIGPAVSRYEIVMPTGISVKKILNYDQDIASVLEANGDVRIEAPIPGKNAVGIEVPNERIATIGLKEVLSSKAWREDQNPLKFALGKDIVGNYKFCDLAKSPHLLVAGATGSGKSVCLNTLIISLIYKSSPEDLRFILIDPKRVEFATYAGLPHLIIPSIINEPDKALNAFNWAINEMERRYMLFENNHVRDIIEYNKLPEIVNGEAPKMFYIVIIVDELADLFSNNKKDFEDRIARLTAKARSAGIHLVLATQRPSVDVVTGVIKTNLPSRIAFALPSGPDSKTILDRYGAEKLLGKGDMLYAPLDSPDPVRIQGSFITNKEIIDIVNYVKENNKPRFEEGIENKMLKKPTMGGIGGGNMIVAGENDELFIPALKSVIESGQPSKTFIQRNFGLGFPRAAKLIDAMQKLKYIVPAENGKKGEVYLTMEDFYKIYGDN